VALEGDALVQERVAVFAGEHFNHLAFDGRLLANVLAGLGVGNDSCSLSRERSREPAGQEGNEQRRKAKAFSLASPPTAAVGRPLTEKINTRIINQIRNWCVIVRRLCSARWEA
jgi:hypothetical protein